MWSTPLCFLFSILGASIAQYGIPYHSKFIFSPSEDSDPIVKTFLEKMTKTIETKDPKQISDLFDDDFSFHGCKGDYDKKKVVFILSQIPSATPFVITLKSSKFISDDKIEYSVTVSGIKSTPIEAKFILCSKHLNLEGGSIPSCQTHHFHGFVSQDNSDDVVQKFLDRMVRSIESKDVSIISGLFEPDFVLKGCKGVYDKKKIIALLEKLPTGTKFSFTLKSSQDTGSSIKYTVSITGFDKNEVIAEFILNKKDQQLESGSVPACQPKSLRGFFQSRPANNFVARNNYASIVDHFLTTAVKSIESRDVSNLSDLFDPRFLFETCDEQIYNQIGIVTHLLSVAPGTNFSFYLKYMEEQEEHIIFLASVRGLTKKEFEGLFALEKENYKLKAGGAIHCENTVFRGNTKGNVSVSSRKFYGDSDEIEDSDEVINRFLGELEKKIRSRDSTAIGSQFDDKFSFKGCKGTYTKNQVVSMIANSSSKSSLQFSLQPPSDYNKYEQIEYTVSVSGAYKTPFDAQFVYDPKENVLKSGKIASCPATRSRGFY